MFEFPTLPDWPPPPWWFYLHALVNLAKKIWTRWWLYSVDY